MQNSIQSSDSLTSHCIENYIVDSDPRFPLDKLAVNIAGILKALRRMQTGCDRSIVPGHPG